MAWLLRFLPAQLRRLSIRQQLLGAFAADLLLMMLLGAFALTQMETVRDKADEVADRSLPSIRNVDRIQDLVARYRRLQLEFALYSNLGDRARTERNLAQIEAQVDAGLTAQEPLLASPAERVAFDRFHSEWRDYVAATHGKFLPAIRRGNTGTVQPALSRLNPQHRRLTTATNKLNELAGFATEEAMTVLRETQKNSHRFIVVVTASSVALSAFLGLALAADLSRRIRKLTTATRRVAAGDLTPHPKSGEAPAMHDEIGFLAENFEQMVDSLRQQREALERRHQELGESLQQQRRLTADLVRREEAEQAAYRARTEAEARDSAKSIFLATMSHELRTPLNAILGYVQLMGLAAEGRDDKDSLQDLSRISSAGKHLATLINNLLDFSKIEQGKVDAEILTFPLADLVDEVVAIVDPLIQQQGNRLELDLRKPLGTMTSDPAKLRQVLFNLLSNAAKFTENGVISLTVERQAAESEQESLSEARSESEAAPANSDRIVIQVADTGIGIHPDQLESIFEPFQQADSSISRRFGGTGLGLVISRRLSRLLGGSLTVESVLGAGSVFTALWPAHTEPTALETRGSSAPAVDFGVYLSPKTEPHPGVRPSVGAASELACRRHPRIPAHSREKPWLKSWS